MNNGTHYIDGNGYKRRRRRMFSKIKLAQTNKKSPVTLQRCDGCGLEKEAQGRTWCDCNPTAPWRMTPLYIVKKVDKVITKHLAK